MYLVPDDFVAVLGVHGQKGLVDGGHVALRHRLVSLEPSAVGTLLDHLVLLLRLVAVARLAALVTARRRRRRRSHRRRRRRCCSSSRCCCCRSCCCDYTIASGGS